MKPHDPKPALEFDADQVAPPRVMPAIAKRSDQNGEDTQASVALLDALDFTFASEILSLLAECIRTGRPMEGLYDIGLRLFQDRVRQSDVPVFPGLDHVQREEIARLAEKALQEPGHPSREDIRSAVVKLLGDELLRVATSLNRKARQGHYGPHASLTPAKMQENLAAKVVAEILEEKMGKSRQEARAFVDNEIKDKYDREPIDWHYLISVWYPRQMDRIDKADAEHKELDESITLFQTYEALLISKYDEDSTEETLRKILCSFFSEK